MRIVLANGCFDLLHAGHVMHLQEAAKMGDYLIVSLTLDQYVNKGPNRPIYIWEQRALLLRELRCVDQVVPSASGADAILKWRPHIFVKGMDYQSASFGEDILGACTKVGAQLRYTSTLKLSTTETIKKVLS